MKVFRKGISVLLSITMLVALCATAFAADVEDIEYVDSEEIQTEIINSTKDADTQETEEEVSEEIVEDDVSDIVDIKAVEETPIEETEPVKEETSVIDEDIVTFENEDTQTYSDVQEDNNDIDTYASKKKLDVIFVMGQSNAQGQINSPQTYEQARKYSISCKNDEVFSTVLPMDLSGTQKTTGVSFSYATNANNVADFIPKSLSSSETYSGGTLEYPLNWLSGNGGGESGPDSGIAYAWNDLTDDAVWVVNISWGGTAISTWVPGQAKYSIATEAMDLVMQTYTNEVSSSGQYDAGDVFMIWMQGEADCWATPSTSVEDYTNNFMSMYNGFKDLSAFKTYPLEACGFITIRYDQTTTGDTSLLDLSARQAQLNMAKNYSDMFIASDANEDWITDMGTKTYFNYWYPDGIKYPTHASSSSGITKPTAVSDVYMGVHYYQVGHNENGITAARGMYNILRKGATTGSTKNTINSSLVYPASSDGSDVVQQSDSRWAYVKNGKIDTSFNGFANNNNGWWYIINGYVDFGVTGIVYGNLGNVYGQWYVSGGKVQVDYTGVTNEAIGTKWYYISDGRLDIGYTGLAPNGNGWWYVKNGIVDFDYTGFAKNENGWWYCEGSQVTFNYHGLVYGTVNGTYGQWYVDGSKVQLDYSGNYYDTYWGNRYISNGLAYANVTSFTTDQYGNDTIHLGNGTTIVPSGITKGNDGNYYYYVNGSVATGTTTVAETYVIDGNDSWYYVENGKVNLGFTGLAENQYGWWYCANGKVDFSYGGIVANEYWTDGWYVEGGQVQFGYTGVANYAASDGTWYYINEGKVDKTKNSVEQNNYGWWYVVKGVVQFNYTGVANYSNDYGWWYINGGKVDFSFNGVASNDYGTWYVEDGQVTFGFTGLSNYADENGDWWYFTGSKKDTSVNDIVENIYGWWYVENGKVNFNVTTVAENQYGWWYVYNGKVDFTYTGLALNEYGWWYCEKGQVLFNYTGLAYSYEPTTRGDHWAYCFNSFVNEEYEDVILDSENLIGNGDKAWYYIDSGWVYSSYTGVANCANEYGWWYIKNGQVDFSYTGPATNKYDMWYVEAGEVKFTYTGVSDYADENGDWWYFSNSQRNLSYTGWASNSHGNWYVVNGKVDFSKS